MRRSGVFWQQIVGDASQLAFVGVGQTLQQVAHWDPRYFGNLGIFVVEVAIEVFQQVVMHRFVDTSAIGDEPVVDDAELGQYAATHARFFPHFTRGSRCPVLPWFDVAFRHAPQQSTSAIKATDERDIDAIQVDRTIRLDRFRQARNN